MINTNEDRIGIVANATEENGLVHSNRDVYQPFYGDIIREYWDLIENDFGENRGDCPDPPVGTGIC